MSGDFKLSATLKGHEEDVSAGVDVNDESDSVSSHDMNQSD